MPEFEYRGVTYRWVAPLTADTEVTITSAARPDPVTQPFASLDNMTNGYAVEMFSDHGFDLEPEDQPAEPDPTFDDRLTGTEADVTVTPPSGDQLLSIRQPVTDDVPITT